MDKYETDALAELAVISGKSFEETAEAFRKFNEAMTDPPQEKFVNNRAGRRKEARKSRLRNDGSKKKRDG